jgi:hypothetical protein
MGNGQAPMIQPGMDGMEFYPGSNNIRAQMGQNGGGQSNSNHALQDYQMQLMLLEQQNKKRLLMARQEQDSIRPGEGPGMAGQAGFAPTMSPQPSRSGPSPNPSEQMKRGTPKMGPAGLPGVPNSPMPDGSMPHGRGSPGTMNMANGMNMDMMQPGMKGVEGMPPMQPGMRPPSSHPGFNGAIPNAQMEAMRAAQAGRMANGGNWPQGPPGQGPGIPQVSQGQPNQQMGTPRQGTAAMPPPPTANNATNGRPASPAAPPAASTPQQSNKPAPAKKDKTNKADRKVIDHKLEIINYTNYLNSNLKREGQQPLQHHQQTMNNRLKRPRLKLRLLQCIQSLSTMVKMPILRTKLHPVNNTLRYLLLPLRSTNYHRTTLCPNLTQTCLVSVVQ